MKNIFKIVLVSLVFSSLIISHESIHVRAEINDTEDISTDAVLPPTRIWWDWTTNVNFGDPYYYEIYRTDGLFRGYLSINWELSYGGNYTYEGYLYHESLHYPIPAKELDEE